MDPLKIKRTKKQGPEAKIQQSIIDRLTLEGWTVKETHGNLYQSGFPDLYCMHPRYGTRWVECKNPAGYSFTPAQLEWFPKFAAAQVGIWILISADDSEINKLFGPANWHAYVWGRKA